MPLLLSMYINLAKAAGGAVFADQNGHQLEQRPPDTLILDLQVVPQQLVAGAIVFAAGRFGRTGEAFAQQSRIGITRGRFEKKPVYRNIERLSDFKKARRRNAGLSLLVFLQLLLGDTEPMRQSAGFDILCEAPFTQPLADFVIDLVRLSRRFYRRRPDAVSHGRPLMFALATRAWFTRRGLSQRRSLLCGFAHTATNRSHSSEALRATRTNKFDTR